MVIVDFQILGLGRYEKMRMSMWYSLLETLRPGSRIRMLWPSIQSVVTGVQRGFKTSSRYAGVTAKSCDYAYPLPRSVLVNQRIRFH